MHSVSANITKGNKVIQINFYQMNFLLLSQQTFEARCQHLFYLLDDLSWVKLTVSAVLDNPALS